MSIFDDIMGNISSFGDAILSSPATGKAVSGLFGGGSNNSSTGIDNQEYKSLRLMNMLTYGVDKLNPNPRPGQYEVTKSQPTASVDPAEVQQRWLSRLNSYTSIVPPPVKGGGK